MKSPKSKFNSKLPEAIFSLGALIALLGGFSYASAHFSSEETSVPSLVSSNTQRNLAIQEAIKNGQKTYEYTTNFIPGIGTVTDPEAYEKQFEEGSANE